MLSFFPRGVSDEILNLIESVSEEFPSYSYVSLSLPTLRLQTQYEHALIFIFLVKLLKSPIVSDLNVM